MVTAKLKKVYTVFLDVGTDTWAWMKDAEDETMYVGSMVGCYKDWGGEHEISKKLLDEAEKWLLTYERSGLYGEDNALAFDWESFHKKGFEIAVKLKQELGDNAAVRYVKPTEDPAYVRDERFEVLDDGTIQSMKRLWWCRV